MSDRDEIKAALVELGITQADFANLIGVTPRGVSLWMVGDRAIPGPAMAYARLLRTLPVNLRQIELSRLNQRRDVMRNGMYAIQFGEAVGLLTFEDGLIYGVDEGGVQYDGIYEAAKGTLVLVKVKVTYPPYANTVIGISNPYEWALDATAILDPAKDIGVTSVTLSSGHVINAQYQFMRSLPRAA